MQDVRTRACAPSATSAAAASHGTKIAWRGEARGAHALSAHAREPHFFGERRAAPAPAASL